jgi:hypothetical protein
MAAAQYVSINASQMRGGDIWATAYLDGEVVRKEEQVSCRKEPRMPSGSMHIEAIGVASKK